MSRVKGEKSENFCEISFLYAFCDSGAVPGAFPIAFSIASSAFLITSRRIPSCIFRIPCCIFRIPGLIFP